jgi:NAD(P)-dependent dehydrogenase (short-subunit alcohol dehydrogenase family)
MSGFFDFVRDQYADLPVPQAPANIKDATYIVTGANSGIGLECTKHLFRMGTKRIILAVRSLDKGEAALAAIRKETGRMDAGEIWELDLASLDSVEAFAERIRGLDRLDALIANAGVAAGSFKKVDGLEMSLLVNDISTMLLALRALPKLQESARSLGTQTHLVVVSSNTAFESAQGRRFKSLEGDVFDALSVEKSFKAFVQYVL